MPALPTDDPDVTDNTDEHRYEIRIEGRLVGYAVYERVGDRTAFVHTVVDSELQGQGLGRRLAKAALDDVRRRGRTAIPQCAFIVDYIDRHPDYRDLLPSPGGAGA
jgi:predicted GNAT family acetyltransferase